MLISTKSNGGYTFTLKRLDAQQAIVLVDTVSGFSGNRNSGEVESRRAGRAP